MLGFVDIKTPYNPTFIEHVKTLPGTSWNPARKAWRVPVELYQSVVSYGKSKNLRIDAVVTSNVKILEENLSLPEELFPLQQKAVLAILRNCRHFVIFETGLGKTAVALTAARVAKCSHALIVTQRAIKAHWQNEISLWAPGLLADIVNYERLKEIDNPIIYDIIIFDEIHNLKSYTTDRYKNAKRILSMSNNPFVVGLSATPIDKPEEIYSLVDLFFPNRFGYWSKFRNYFFDVEHHRDEEKEWMKIKGVKPQRADELRDRLASMCSYAAHTDFENHLNPLEVEIIKLKTSVHFSNVTSINDWMRHLKLSSPDKISRLKEELKLISDSKIVIISYTIETAEEIARELSHLNPILITGEKADRETLLHNAQSAEDAVLIASLKSISTGIDLTSFTLCFIVELSYSLSQTTQLLGRFKRLSGKHSVKIKILTAEKSVDEAIALSLKKKIGSQKDVLNTNSSQQTLLDAMEDDLNELRDALKEFYDEDFSGL